jgi:peptidyl-tRNA hydrolase
VTEPVETVPAPPANAELVLPMVVRVERATPPVRTDALEAAARAVLLMLTADRPEWAPAVNAWDGQRIRKVVRRARGSAWQRALTVDGLDVTQASAELRVYPPVPIDAWPPELSRLQVGGTELDDPEPPPAPEPGTPLIVLTPLVQMTAGKAMAQAAHATQLGWRASSVRDRARWAAAGFPLAVRQAGTAAWRTALAAGSPVVHDGGFTEVEPNTQTALAVLPWLTGGRAR